jgi:MerR family copper efflux transcriptional regulator
LGFTLKEIQELLSLRVSTTARCGDVQQKAQVKLKHVENKMRDLKKLAQSLQDLIAACRAGEPTDHCPILKALDSKTD